MLVKGREVVFELFTQIRLNEHPAESIAEIIFPTRVVDILFPRVSTVLN